MQCSDSFQKKESDIRQKDCLDVYVIFVDNMLYNDIYQLKLKFAERSNKSFNERRRKR